MKDLESKIELVDPAGFDDEDLDVQAAIAKRLADVRTLLVELVNEARVLRAIVHGVPWPEHVAPLEKPEGGK